MPRSEVKVYGFGDFYGDNFDNQTKEETLKQIIAQFGPVYISFDASPITFNFYKEGIYNDEDCSTRNFNHAALLVGYGRDEDLGMDYWLVKNSWSKDWGENGYIRIARNNNETCGIGFLGGNIALLDAEAMDKNDFRNVRLMVVGALSACLLIFCCCCACFFCCYRICCRRSNQYSI